MKLPPDKLRPELFKRRLAIAAYAFAFRKIKVKRFYRQPFESLFIGTPGFTL